MKKVLKVILILSLILTVISVPSYALQEESVDGDIIIKPMFTYIMYMAHYFDIASNGRAEASAFMTAYKCDQVEVVVELQQYDPKNFTWKTIKSWSSFVDGEDTGAGGYWWVPKGYLYRSVAYGYVYVNGVMVEDHEMVSETEYY